jgi:twitching motility two-component system response regulator PilG
MQGNLDEIDIRSILQLIEVGQRTGVLFVVPGAPKHHWGAKQAALGHNVNVCWFVFFLNGQIVYASNNGGQSRLRLDDYLRHYRVKVRLDETQLEKDALQSLPEYTYLWALLEQNIINTTQARSIIQGLIDETIFDLLNLQQGNFLFEVTSPLAPVLTTWDTVALTSKVIKQVQDWKQLYPYIQSPDQLPMLASVLRLQSCLPTATANKLKQWADGKTSLRQLARYLNRDILTVAKALYPYVQQGWVHMVYTNTIDLIEQPTIKENQAATTKTIVFIHDQTSICNSVESILMSEGFLACAFTNSIEALNGIFTLKPNLIVCKLTMPELNGYEISAMLRSCQAFRYLPIIMLTDQDDFTLLAKAKMAGATECLSKPFNNTELIMLVKKYLNNAPYGTSKNITLVDGGQYRVKNSITSPAKIITNKNPSFIKFVKE